MFEIDVFNRSYNCVANEMNNSVQFCLRVKSGTIYLVALASSFFYNIETPWDTK